jgi:hypothetical protein
MCLKPLNAASTSLTTVTTTEKKDNVKVETGNVAEKVSVKTANNGETKSHYAGKIEKQGKAETSFEIPHSVERTLTQFGAELLVKQITRGGAMVPVAGAAIGAGITAWDTKDALDKTRDKNVGIISTAFAWTTVGLDAVATGTTATGILAPVGAVVQEVAMWTSAASDMAKILKAY